MTRKFEELLEAMGPERREALERRFAESLEVLRERGASEPGEKSREAMDGGPQEIKS